MMGDDKVIDEIKLYSKSNYAGVSANWKWLSDKIETQIFGKTWIIHMHIWLATTIFFNCVWKHGHLLEYNRNLLNPLETISKIC